MAKAKRNKYIDWLQYIGLRMAVMVMHAFPIDANLQFAKFLGGWVYFLDRKHRDRALGNLRRSFPDLPESDRQLMARQSLQQISMLFVEIFFTSRLIHLETWANYVELANFSEVLKLLLRRDKGIIMLSGHYGNFEVLGYVLATLGFQTTSIARPLDNPYVNDWIMGIREKKGQKIISKKGATDEVTQVLDTGGAVGFIADQNAGPKGIFVDFFGRKASTFKSIGLLAMQYKVPVVVGCARRINDRFRFRVEAQDIIYPADWEHESDPLRYITQRFTKGIEDFVRKDPAQYFWMHRRWKSRPKGEAPEAFD
jgi:KDO2-lipid IV(A) lauroyltransferase